MNWKWMINYIWKLLICWMAFLISLFLEAMLLSSIGFGFPALWEIIAATRIPLLFGSVFIAFILSVLSSNLRIHWFFRWIILEMFLWEVGVVGLILKSFLPAPTSHDLSLFSTLSLALTVLLPSLVLSLLIACLFRPAQTNIPIHAHRKKRSITLRIIAGSIAYPLVYLFSCLMAQSIFREASGFGVFAQTHQSWRLFLSLQLIHGSILLAASLPIIKWWQGGDGKLWWMLGASFSLLPAITTALFSQGLHLTPANILQNIFIGLGYAGVLVSLFRQSNIATDGRNLNQWHREIVGFAVFFRQKMQFWVG